MDSTVATAVAAVPPAYAQGIAAACTPYILPAQGVLSIYGAEPTVLPFDGVFQPDCLARRETEPEDVLLTSTTTQPVQVGSDDSTQEVIGGDPFYASIFPQCYALAATTVLAYVLFLMLLIVPRSFLDGGIVILGRRGFTNGPSHGISIGGRPWLQKLAALSVTISLTIATVDTFRVAERQFSQGMQNAQELQAEVLGGTQLKVIQLVSDTFLWLAQAQTLIRLFPRQREKIIIKWTAFSLITLDIIFGALNSFKYVEIGTTARPLNFTEPVAALSYLFQLSLGLLYAAWVIYYSLMKKRYAFYHPLMKNISLMATLSIFSLLVPVVFFVLDMAKPDITGWGEYVRWVGAAAASVVVWEWVERIEALEREEKKDGILGREVFDGDELMDNTASDIHSWHHRRKNSKKGTKPGGDGGDSGKGTSTSFSTSSGTPTRTWPAMSSIANRHAAVGVATTSVGTTSDTPEAPPTTNRAPKARQVKGRFLNAPFWPSRPAPAVTPISRTETASADSTVYAVRYQPFTESSSGMAHHDQPYSIRDASSSPFGIHTTERSESSASPPNDDHIVGINTVEPEGDAPEPSGSSPWYSPRRLGLLRVASRGPPAEVLPHTAPRQNRRNHDSTGRWDVKGRWDDFAANHAEKVMERMRGTPDVESLPVTVIPAPPRPGAALAQLLQDEGGTNMPARTGDAPRAAPPPALRSIASTSSAAPLSSLPLRNLSVSPASRPAPAASESVRASIPRPRVAGEDWASQVSPTSRRPVVRYESSPVLPSNDTSGEASQPSDGHRHVRTPQPPR